MLYIVGFGCCLFGGFVGLDSVGVCRELVADFRVLFALMYVA